jgi:hypothetical protein
LASTKNELATTKDELEKTKDLIVIGSIVTGWGIIRPNTLWLKADTSKMLKYKGVIKLMLIVRAAYSNVDRMTDTSIAKSIEYSLVNGEITLTSTYMDKLRISGDEATLEFNLVGLPVAASSEGIDSLAAIDKVNGHIISSRAMLGHLQVQAK